ncbi:methyltransferase domain-containing protein [Methylobacterium sp. ID0610]|uniref:methyltransferase domain-containing protein n=1 Tax=Methylobacterium carpenticola TaxID=3344827 RepID=UPI0036A597C9
MREFHEWPSGAIEALDQPPRGEMMMRLAAPRRFKAHARAARFLAKSAVRIFGNQSPRQCSLCGHEGRFFAYGFPLTADVTCPACLSLERHRALALYMSRTPFIAGKEVLHFAPEPGLSKFIRDQGPKRYVTCDLFARNVDLKIDIEAIALPDASFDVVFCLHVLEHVDDRRALAEIRRVLRPGGLAVLMVPIEEGLDETYENPAITQRADRLVHFGQEDHVRYYGRDFRDRVRAAGFALEEWVSKEPDVLRYGLKRGERIFLATKADGPA